MKKFFIGILILSTLVFAKNYGGFKKLKALKAYSPNSYNLAKDIKYLELRRYTYSNSKNLTKRGTSPRYELIAVAKRGSVSKKLIKKLRSYPPILSKKADIHTSGICIMSGCNFLKGNAFVIDNKNKMWKMDEASDVLTYLGKIDTEAELKMLLWVKSIKYDNSKYRKVKNGYEVIAEYDNSINNVGECGHFVYRLRVSKWGDISERLLSKTQSKNGCLAMD